jgi:hypothetical protein
MNQLTTKASKWKNMALNKPQKGHVFAAREMKQKGEASPCSNSAGDVPTSFHCSAHNINDHKSTVSASFGVTDKFHQVEEATYIELSNKEDLSVSPTKVNILDTYFLVN